MISLAGRWSCGETAMHTVEGLAEGDNVKYYQVIVFDAAQATGWKFTTQFSSLSADILDAIIQARPSLRFYPAVGMQYWWLGFLCVHDSHILI